MSSSSDVDAPGADIGAAAARMESLDPATTTTFAGNTSDCKDHDAPLCDGPAVAAASNRDGPGDNVDVGSDAGRKDSDNGGGDSDSDGRGNSGAGSDGDHGDCDRDASMAGGQAKQFQRCPEDFACGHCGHIVEGNGYTNHCTACLWSRHVDINPGDRAASCRGLMAAVYVDNKKGNLRVLQRCVDCGHERWNRRQEDDDFDAFIQVTEAARNADSRGSGRKNGGGGGGGRGGHGGRGGRGRGGGGGRGKANRGSDRSRRR